MHTPGPWTVDTDSDTVLGPRGNVVAQCPGYSRRSDNPLHMAQGSREANALLIAASPALLAACKQALAILAQPATYPADLALIRTTCAAAIAQATT